MRPGRIELVHNFTGETEWVIITWVKTSAPLTEVGREEYPAPHTQESLLVEDLSPVMHLVRAWRSSDGVALDEQINELAVDAGARSTYFLTTYEYIVDRGYTNLAPVNTGTEVWSDPVNSTVELRDERLLGGNYSVEIRGTGKLGPDEYTDRSDDGGGFDLADGTTWNEDARIYVTLQNRVDSTETGSQGGGEVTDVVLLTAASTDLISSMYGKLLVSNISAALGVLVIPNFTTIPDTFIKISTHSGSQRYLTIQFDIGDNVTWRGRSVNRIHMRKADSLKLVWVDNSCYVLDYIGDGSRVGRREWGEMLELNTIYRDGSTYNQDDYPGLIEDFLDLLPGAQVVSYATWDTSVVVNVDETIYPNKSKWARDDVAGTFRVPDDRNKSVRALANVTGAADSERNSQGPGGYQHYKTSLKGVTFEIRNGSGGSSTGSIVGTGFSGQDSFAGWVDGIEQVRHKAVTVPPGGNAVNNFGMLPIVFI